MTKLHNHPGCTKYFHDIIDIIHDDMLVVLSKRKDGVRSGERIRSGELLRKISTLHDKMTDSKDKGYGQAPCPEPRVYPPQVGVKVELNPHAKKIMDRVLANDQNRLVAFEGDIVRAKTKVEMESVD